jgi:hypothetical protein
VNSFYVTNRERRNRNVFTCSQADSEAHVKDSGATVAQL